MADVKEGSVWYEGVEIPQFAPLQESIEADVVIIGAGITGVTAAYLLSESGQKVVLVEKDRIGSGATGMTTAFLTQYVDTEISELLNMFGKEKAKQILNSHAKAIDIVEDIVRKEEVQCDFMRCPNFIYAHSDRDTRQLKHEQTAGEKIGLHMEFTKNSDLPFKPPGHLKLSNQAKFHPLKYLAGLTEIIQEQGVRIFEETEIVEMNDEESMVLKTQEHEIRANKVMVATYAPFDKKLHFKKAFYSSYIIEAAIPSNSLPEAIYEDTYDPYHYFRVDRMEGKDRLILGGADHRSDIPVKAEKNFRALEEYVHEIFSGISYEIVRRWKGPILEPVDGLAYIGPVENDNVIYATGFSGNGMTYGIIAAAIATDLVGNRQNDWLPLYTAKRKPNLKQLGYKGRDYTEELIGGAVRNTMKYRKK